MKGYLHSNKLCWSYGAIKGRSADQWQKEFVKKPLEEMVNALIFIGFNGIYIDRYGYKDNGKEVEDRLARTLEIKPLVSANARLSFFSFAHLIAQLKSQYSDEEWQKKKTVLLGNVSS